MYGFLHEEHICTLAEVCARFMLRQLCQKPDPGWLRRNLWQVQGAGAGRALLTSDVVKLRGVRNRARDGACCDDMCCDARGVMHEYIMAIFLGKSENQEGGGMLIVKVGGN